jgi:Polyketide cyclase / dehydrase and lipid transport
MIEFTIVRTTSAPIEAVFDRLTDHANYKNMSPLRTSELVRPGSPEPNGVGAVRRMGLIGPTQTEEVTVFERPTRFGYELRSGLPVRDHVGTVELARTNAGTSVTYSVRSTPTLPIPGLGFVLGIVLKQGISGLLDGIVRAAEQSPAT